MTTPALTSMNAIDLPLWPAWLLCIPSSWSYLWGEAGQEVSQQGESSQMAKKPNGDNKSALTRKFVAKHPSAGPKQIVEGLKAEGVEVSLALASENKYDRPKKGRRKKAAGRDNKAEAIRQAAKSLGKNVRPRDVIAALKDQGITVTSAQVSTTLKRMGMRPKGRGRKPGMVAANGSRSISINDLIAAKKLVNQLGSVAAASHALSALAKLS